METFVSNKRKVAKTVFVIFTVSFVLISFMYAMVSVISLVKIVKAFELTFSQISHQWYDSLENVPFPGIEEGTEYSLNIESPSASDDKLVAVYTPGKNGAGGDVNFVDSDGNRASLYKVMGFVSDVKRGASLSPASYQRNRTLDFEQVIQCFESDAVKSSDTVFGKILTIVENDYTFPVINKKRLGYNLIVLLTKSGLNSGKTVSVSDENGESKARKYTFVINKNHMNNFVKKILQDGSVENNSAVRDISDMFFDVIKQCKDTDFKISAVIHKGKVISVECETPEISGNAYIISITRNETDGKLGLNINNISQNKNVMKASAECRNGNIRFLYAGNKPEITADVITDNNRAKISILEKNKFSLNFMTQKTNQSYDIEFYKDKRFIKPPYLSVYLTKNSR